MHSEEGKEAAIALAYASTTASCIATDSKAALITPRDLYHLKHTEFSVEHILPAEELFD